MSDAKNNPGVPLAPGAGAGNGTLEATIEQIRDALRGPAVRQYFDRRARRSGRANRSTEKRRLR